MNFEKIDAEKITETGILKQLNKNIRENNIKISNKLIDISSNLTLIYLSNNLDEIKKNEDVGTRLMEECFVDSLRNCEKEQEEILDNLDKILLFLRDLLK